MLTLILIFLALMSCLTLISHLYFRVRQHTLNWLDIHFLSAYLEKIDTLPAIIESLENAWVNHEDLAQMRIFHRNAIIFSRSSTYLILKQNEEVTRTLKILMRISLPYTTLQQSWAFIHAREIFTKNESYINHLKEEINIATEKYEFARKLQNMTTLGLFSFWEKRHMISR